MLFVCEKRARFILGFILIGIFVCLFSSELSGIIFGFLDMGSRFLTINVTPFTEEMLKAIPVLILVFSFDPDNQQILEASIAVGVGFAILENAFILAGNVDIVTISLALIRGFGAGMMHGLCTFTLGYGLTIIRKKRKFFFPGTVAFLSISIMFSSLKFFGIFF
ncbi:MAG: PrsW family intramembrane metalloprotease, partial [Clostridia bacterium]|nr:PrsW family intramembrane metalloprotease [Clostridia bacterium]